MAKFRKKPVVIEAFEWTGSVDTTDWAEWAIAGDSDITIVGEYLKIRTLEGVMTASAGDWIIRGVSGEIYPCKPDIFEKTYEAVEDDDGSLYS